MPSSIPQRGILIEIDNLEEESSNKDYISRAIMILMALGKQGPSTLSELDKVLDIPRVSIWRALQNLSRAGWVRMSVRRHAYELSVSFSQFVREAQFALDETVEVDAFCSRGEGSKYFSMAGILHGSCQFTAIEPNSIEIDVHGSASPVFDPPVRVALLACTLEERHRHIALFLKSNRCSAEERDAIEDGEFWKALQKDACQGILFHVDRQSFSVPVRYNTGAAGSFTFSIFKRTQAGIEQFTAFARLIGSMAACESYAAGHSYSGHRFDALKASDAIDLETRLVSASCCSKEPRAARWLKLYEKHHR
ncbi:helix-turn-helix domain-containing protein [Anianabacter salinae]|uniref:helix-turn-helix domain-containing protein n=1 Tax=Anianabacter salinae TaxID=2851023 RepID=UPI00225DF2E5|nr:helix-turn-helix domain-containing protein [Anianabacter salinae]MBV0914234.1 helix-turn-helix domain-containing protein [Anianabacter salinae]